VHSAGRDVARRALTQKERQNEVTKVVLEPAAASTD
jgi:hypothetical protein